MVEYKDVQNFYDHGNCLIDYDETIDVDAENPSTRPRYKIANATLWVFVILGCFEVLHIVQRFIPTAASWFSLLVLIPAVMSCAYVTSAMAEYWEKRWALRKKESLLLHAAIRKAIWTIDFSPLLPACNPNWLEFTKNNSYDWKLRREAKQKRQSTEQTSTDIC